MEFEYWNLSPQYLLYLFIKHIFRRCAYLLVNHLAALYKEHTWNTGHSIVDREIRILIHIHFTYVNLPLIIFCKCINCRA